MNLILSPVKFSNEQLLEVGDLVELDPEVAKKMPWAHRPLSTKEVSDLQNGAVPASLSHPSIPDDQKQVVHAALKAAEKAAAAKPAAKPEPKPAAKVDAK